MCGVDAADEVEVFCSSSVNKVAGKGGGKLRLLLLGVVLVVDRRVEKEVEEEEVDVGIEFNGKGGREGVETFCFTQVGRSRVISSADLREGAADDT